MAISTTPYWREDYPRPADLATAAAVPERVDVAVVGAGLTGLNAALVLAAGGATVAVLESGEVGAGASTVNGGQVNYGLKLGADAIFRRYGDGLGRELWDASLRAIDLVEQIVAGEGIECFFTRCGGGELGHTSRDLRHFEHTARWMDTRLGFPMQVVGPDGIRDVVDSPAYHCALLEPASASLHPARYTYGLARAAARRGVHLVEHAPVAAIERTGPGYVLATGRGVTRASEVLIATNGYTGMLVPALRRRVVPVGSYMVATEPLRADVAERLIPGNRVFFTARRFLNYFRRSPDDRILMGGRNDLSTDLDLLRSAGVLGSVTSRVFPTVAGVPVTHSWNGKLAVTFDLMPHIGRIDGVWFALGYAGHGVGVGTLLGREAAGLMTGVATRSPFADIAFQSRFYYRRSPWFLPAAAQWYRVLDRFGL